MSKAADVAKKWLAEADIEVNGDRPWDFQVQDERIFARVMAEGSLGLGEAYMDEWWDAEQLDAFFYRVLRAHLNRRVWGWQEALGFVTAKILNLQTPSQAFQVGQRHYDIGNDLYDRMLDKQGIYSCGYWKDATNLDEAQEAKLDLVCRKLGLKPGMRLLDIGCGWGGTARYAAERYGVEVVGVTVSKEQVAHGKELCTGLPIEIRLQDYRDLDESFDRILSIGMIEHVGSRNYRTFMKVARQCLKEDGLLLLHTIGSLRSVTSTNPWINRYIFTNSMLPSARQLSTASEEIFVMEDWHNFGADYDKTLMAWFHNFDARWPEIAEKYGQRFYRMWKCYLMSCAGSFRARLNQVWQIVYSPTGVPGGYVSIR